MDQITLNDFIGFVGKSEKAKERKVREIMQREEYSPGRDYWKTARDEFKKFHKSGAFDSADLDKILLKVNPKKIENYTEIVDGYKKFLNTFQPLYFEPNATVWMHRELAIKVNPDLGLIIGGEKHLVKLYLKKEKFGVSQLFTIFELMKESLTEPSDAKISIVKVRESKLLTMGNSDTEYKKLLKLEADSFIEILKKMEVREVSQKKK